jgi:hypothetical protein
MCLLIPNNGILEKLHIRVLPILLASLTCKYICTLVREIINDFDNPRNVHRDIFL